MHLPSTANLGYRSRPTPMAHATTQHLSAPLPADLVVDSVIGSSSRPHVGEAVWYAVTVRNAGGMPAGPFTVGLRGDAVHEDRAIPGLDAGDTVVVEDLGPVRPQMAGRPLLIQAVADPEGRVPDANRLNNDLWDSLWVQP